MAKLPFIGGFNALEDAQSANERTINMIPEMDEGKTQWRLRASPGLRPFCTLPDEVQRGSHSAQERAFIVAGANLYELFEDGTFVVRGVITLGSTTVSMDDNGFQLGVVDGERGWVLTLATNVFQQIIDENFFPTQVLVVQDGYAVGVRLDTQQFFHSDLYNMLNWLPLDFASAESNPDKLVTIAKDSTGLVMLGTQSLELFQTTPTSNRVFQRRGGSTTNYGCGAVFSARSADNGILWIGRDNNGQGTVYRLAGAIPTAVSSIPIDENFQGAVNIADAVAFTYQQSKHAYYAVNIPGIDTTFVLDLSTGVWHERRSFSELGVLGRHRAQHHCFAFGKNIVSAYDSGEVFYFDTKYYKDGERLIRRERTCTPIFDAEDYAKGDFSAFGIDCVVGEGETNPPFDDPVVSMSVSNDGGRTFSNERFKSVGKRGEYSQKVEWRRCGLSRNRVFKVACAAPVPFAINGAYVK